MKYDIFISYRRKASFETANLIAEKLRHAGYKVFFDVDTLNAGKFNVQLLEVIKGCKDFIVVLPEHALDRCADPEDWVRQEVLCAMDNGKNIIPVMLAGFEWPQPMPEGMEELPNYQAITSAGHDYFDMAIERLKRYLQSKPSKLSKHLLTWIISAAVILLTCLGLLAYIGWRSSKSICTDIASQLTSDMATLDLLADVNTDLEESVHYYFDKAPSASQEDLEVFNKNLIASLDKAEMETDRYLKNFPPPQFDITPLQSIILKFRGIEKEELEGFPVFYQSMFDDMKDHISNIHMFMDQQNLAQSTLTNLEVGFHCFRYSLNALYYAYIQQLSAFPKECRKTHNQLSGKWKNYPNGIPFGLSNEEYDNFQMQEMARMEAELMKLNSIANYEEQQLDEIDEQLKDLDRRAKALEEGNQQ